MTHDRPPLSVVIPTRDRPDLLRRATASVLAAMGPDDELIVVDSASVDADAVSRVVTDPRARVLRSERPGATVARNLGWRQARHDLVGFIDDDVEVDSGWADAFVGCWERHPDAVFITGRIRIPPGQGTLAVAVKDDPEPASFGRRDAGLLGHSASLAVPRARLIEVGGFDESLGPGSRFREADDVDLFDRLIAAGGEGRYEPSADATHDQWRRIRQYVVLQHDYGFGSGARLSKLRRSDPARFRVAAREDVWRWGLMVLPSELRRRDWFRAMGSVLRVLGVVRGFLRASFVPVSDGHFRPRSVRNSSS
jgi:glycosyltransferase involved in cell wall biosynthesis